MSDVISMDIEKAMENLVKTKVLFRNEKDFRNNLGRVLVHLYPDSKELRYDATDFYRGTERVDILATHEDMSIGIELKYSWVVVGNTESFVYEGKEYCPPKYGQPEDRMRFNFLEDLHRLESVAMDHSDVIGYAILLTNKQGLWNPPRKRKPNDLMFRLHEDRGAIHGKLKWVGDPAQKTRKMTGDSITVRGNYLIKWHDFLEIPNVRNGTFRFLTIKVE